ncbi:hypothetical protein B0H19DRAFT_1371245, partial [Mycena capillaripes]
MAARHAIDPLFVASPVVVDMDLQIERALGQLETLAKGHSLWARPHAAYLSDLAKCAQRTSAQS